MHTKANMRRAVLFACVCAVANHQVRFWEVELTETADDAMQSDVLKIIHPLYPISLCWLNLNSQSFV